MHIRRHVTRLPVGFALCPCCCEAFDLSEREGTFTSPAIGYDLLVFVLCEGCDARFQSANDSSQRKIAATSYSHVWDAQKSPNLFAVTTWITLWWNNGNLVRAFELGCDLPRAVYESLARGESSMTRLPGGEILDICNDVERQ